MKTSRSKQYPLSLKFALAGAGFAILGMVVNFGGSFRARSNQLRILELLDLRQELTAASSEIEVIAAAIARSGGSQSASPVRSCFSGERLAHWTLAQISDPASWLRIESLRRSLEEARARGAGIVAATAPPATPEQEEISTVEDLTWRLLDRDLRHRVIARALSDPSIESRPELRNTLKGRSAERRVLVEKQVRRLMTSGEAKTILEYLQWLELGERGIWWRRFTLAFGRSLARLEPECGVLGFAGHP